MSSPPDSPLSSLGSEDGRSTPQPGADARSAFLETPSHSHRRASDASHDDSLHPSKRRKTGPSEEPPDDDWEMASLISEDSFTSAPGSPSAGEHALRSEAVTSCQWEGCTAGNLGNSDGLIQHVQNEHVGAKRAKYTCDWGDCARKGMNHPSGYALKAHMRSHTKEKPFFCALPECDRSFTRSDALAKHMRTVHEPEPPKASLTNANPIDPATGQPKKGPKLRLLNGTKTNVPALTADKNPLNAGLSPNDPEWDPSPPNDNIRYTPAHHPVTGQPGFLINYPPDVHFSQYESEIPADHLMRLLRRQLAWAKKEGEELEGEIEELERVKREEWIAKEALLEGFMEAELRAGEAQGAVREKLRVGLESDLRLEKIKWNREPEWRKRRGLMGLPKDLPYVAQAVDVDQERIKREEQADKIVEGERADDMMAVGALMGLSGAS
ncbi:hypothetical protein CAC42_1282 [Sphaceloma murrayae]|uniref:C2H2-type domain-containing protein n=1 Tax=Sphaceloma murrayae TaxID=2082308 RepID=A0A2K1R2V6_9PEZI|nr:hypothetical protein CAC42_1282 [Sphaceloma murrayae]